MWYIYIQWNITQPLKRMKWHHFEMTPFTAMWINLEIIILSEVSQRKTNILWYFLYVKSKKKNDTNKHTYKTKEDSQT